MFTVRHERFKLLTLFVSKAFRELIVVKCVEFFFLFSLKIYFLLKAFFKRTAIYSNKKRTTFLLQIIFILKTIFLSSFKKEEKAAVLFRHCYIQPSQQTSLAAFVTIGGKNHLHQTIRVSFQTSFIELSGYFVDSAKLIWASRILIPSILHTLILKMPKS